MNIDMDLLARIKSGDFEIKYKLYIAPTFIYSNTGYVTDSITKECIDDLVSLGLLEDFIKMLVIQSNNYLFFHIGFRDYSDNYLVYRVNTGTTRGISYYTNINQGHVSDLKIPWLFPSEDTYLGNMGGWFDVLGNRSGFYWYNQLNSMYQFIRWFYEVATNARTFVHPWNLGAGGAYALVRAINHIDKDS